MASNFSTNILYHSLKLKTDSVTKFATNLAIEISRKGLKRY